MTGPVRSRWGPRAPAFIAWPFLALLGLPLLSLAVGSGSAHLAEGWRDPAFWPALRLSLVSSTVAVLVVVVLGTPLAWWLAQKRGGAARWAQLVVDVPVVLPPAVVGLALLTAFGRQGGFGQALAAVGVTLPFSFAAVVLAQVIIGGPFYVHAVAAAFARVDDDLWLVARTLGHSGRGAFFRVALPVAWPGVLAGASLCWARALGEFGATLLFAGNRPGVTQTMPLAIYTALESSVASALALSWALAGLAGLLLFGLRAVAQRGAGGAP